MKLFTEHINDGHMHQEDVVLNVYNLQLDQLLKVSPYAPPVKGSVSADMRFAWDESSVKGRGSVSLVEMYLGRDRVGSFDLGVDLATSKSGLVTANASLMVDNVKAISVIGSLNDTTKTSPVSLDLSMIRFPLRVVNPFLPRNTARLSGMLNGQMAISGDLSSPRFDGYVAFDSTQMLINIIGSTFSFSNEKVPVTDNVVRFDNYAINGANQHPLTIDGRVDVGNLLSPQIDLYLKARNMQFMNSTRGKGTDIYGKGYMDLDATVKGDLSLLNVDATVDLLGGSNITYIMADASTSLMSQNTGEMVRFVEFADTVKVETVDEEETSSMAMNLDAKIIVSGVNKTYESLNGILEYSKGEGIYTIESMNHFNILDRCAKENNITLNILIRLTSGNQFGLCKSDFEEVLRLVLDNDNMSFAGIHYYSGTQKKMSKIEKELSMLNEYAHYIKETYDVEYIELEYGPSMLVSYFEEENRPQTHLDRDIERGMGITVGRLREDTIFDYKFVGLSHNTLRGAAGGAVLMAELLYKEGYLE